MSDLETEIRNQIESEGPLSIAEFMALCLTHPTYGYYTTGNPIGKQGDFITAPEVSQMFGELLGVWCMDVWQKLGSPKQFNLVEYGPGRGTLMQDLLRATATAPAFLEAAKVHLIEISPTLIKQQKSALKQHSKSVRWIENIDALPNYPTIIIANEFLDALPFRQWVKHEESWYERAVGYKDDKFLYTIRPNKIDLSELPAEHIAKPDGSIYETAPSREAIISDLARLIKQQTGAALFIDYGSIQPGFGDTFQAVHNHQYSNPLENFGRCDLTNHVDFSRLITIANAEGCSVANPINQAQFLLSLGLLERAGMLGSGQDTATQETIRLAVERLAGPEQMGKLFKVMAFSSLGPDWQNFG